MKEVFLDAASNTAIDRKVLRKIRPYMTEKFVGNSRSIHDFGIRASIEVEKARKKISEIVCVEQKNVIFTSGATESNNMVIKGLAYRELSSKKAKKNQKRHIICSATEHDSVINACKQLEKIGFKVDYVSPNKEGGITLDDVKELFTDNTLLICVMSVNNELGTMNQVKQITSYAKEKGVFSLVDCTQLVGYGGPSLELGFLYPNADYFSFSGHKIYGPEGTGCLIVNNEDALEALVGNGLIVGGAQEEGIRGGTSNVPGIVGIATALERMYSYKMQLSLIYNDLYEYLTNQLSNVFGDKWHLNAIPRHKNIISLNFECLSNSESVSLSLAEELAIQGVAVSAGSACDSQHDESEGDFNPSHVLVALGLNEHGIRSTVRVSFNRKTTRRDVDLLVRALQNIYTKEILVND